MNSDTKSLRLDVWLWRTRFFKTRTLATEICRTKGVRLNGQRCRKPSTNIHIDDMLTFTTAANDVKAIKVISMPVRRGPAPEAQSHFIDLTPKSPKANIASDAGTNRTRKPNKKERRALYKLKATDN